MNYCNFSKVFQARTSKDKNVLDWFQSGKSNTYPTKPKFVNDISDKQRHSNYISLISTYSALHMPYSTFRLNLRRLQDYVTKCQNYKNCNKNKERETFLDHFSFQTWLGLTETEKKSHSLLNCDSCNNIHREYSELHASFFGEPQRVSEACLNLAEHVISKFQNSKSPTSAPKKGINMMKNVVDMLQPVIEDKTGINFTNQLSKNINSTITYPEIQRNAIVKNIKSSNKTVEKVMSEDNVDVMNFLASGKSYNLHDSDRMNSSFVSKEKAKQKVENKLQTEKSGKSKSKVHHAKFENYDFDRDAFLDELQRFPPNKPINWTRLAKKYNLTRQGQVPPNAGQVLMQYAKSKGVDVYTFNKSKRVSGRDYLRRVRRSKIKLKHRISIPTVRSSRELKKIIKNKLTTNELNIGEKIAPKIFRNTKIDDKGMLVCDENIIFGRKIPLKDIITEEIQRFHEAGIFKGSRVPTAGGQDGDGTQKTLNIKVWHDHSEILNHSYVNFMVSFLYDHLNYLTDEEFKEKFPQSPPLDVQSFVEKPRLYIFGKSGKCKMKNEIN